MNAGNRRRVLPPVFLVLIFLAIFLAIVASAGPIFQRQARSESPQDYAKKTGASIKLFAARKTADGKLQCMIRIHNPHAAAVGELHLRGPRVNQSHTVDLPADGDGDYFIDVADASPDWLRVDLTSSATVDRQSAWLARSNRASRLVLAGAVSSEVAKMVRVYSTRMAAGDIDFTPTVLVTDRVPADVQAAMIVASGTSATTAPALATVVPHALTANVSHWPANVSITSTPPGFTSLVQLNGQTLVAVRETPARQVWLNADTAKWSHEADFVVFFANALGWLAGANVDFSASPMRPVGTQWHRVTDADQAGDPQFSGRENPGVFQSDSGEFLALDDFAPDTPAVDITSPVKSAQSDVIHLAPGLFISALVMAIVSAFLWR